MKEHNTEIDTVAIQLNLNNINEQDEAFKLLQSYIIKNKLGYLKNSINNNPYKREYLLLSGHSKILAIQTGSIQKKNRTCKTQYYIRVKAYGLKSYHKSLDLASHQAFKSICAVLNSFGYEYELCELDVAIDIFAKFENVLVDCMKRSPNVAYNTLGDTQFTGSGSTSYIEDYSVKNRRDNAILRSYLYDKSAKEKLDFSVTRFEIKFQNRFFINSTNILKSIQKVLDKYCIMYFDQPDTKSKVINNLKKMPNSQKSDLYLSVFKYCSLYHNINDIQQFLWEIETTSLDMFGNLSVEPMPLFGRHYKPFQSL
jgi:hypothetical protein